MAINVNKNVCLTLALILTCALRHKQLQLKPGDECGPKEGRQAGRREGRAKGPASYLAALSCRRKKFARTQPLTRLAAKLPEGSTRP